MKIKILFVIALFSVLSLCSFCNKDNENVNTYLQNQAKIEIITNLSAKNFSHFSQ